MALIIEDGTNVSGAQSYVTDAELAAYASLRGYTLPDAEVERESLLIKAMDYLASLEDDFQGWRVASDQPLSFPRYGVELYGYLLESDAIPNDLKNAQIELAIQANTGDLLLNESGGNLASFNVQGVYSETYSGSSFTRVKSAKADAYLGNLLKGAGAASMVSRT